MGACFAPIDMASVLWAIGIGVPVAHVVAEMIVITTHTPVPGSTSAKIYRLIDVLAGQVGRAKETGLLPIAPGQLDKLLTQAEMQLAQLKGK